MLFLHNKIRLVVSTFQDSPEEYLAHHHQAAHLISSSGTDKDCLLH